MGLTVDSEYLELTLKTVVEHILQIAPKKSRYRYLGLALGTILTLLKKSPFWRLTDVVWIDELLGRAVEWRVNNELFTQLLRFRALSTKYRDDQIVASETLIPEGAIFDAISRAIVTCNKQWEWWNDEAMYGGLAAMRNIRRLGSRVPDVTFLRTLSCAMETREGECNFGVRKAAFDVIFVARDGWLTSDRLREALQKFDIPRRLHGVTLDIPDSDYQCGFLDMMEILSKDRKWHPYLREAMDIWLPLRSEGWKQIVAIFARVAEIPSPEIRVFSRRSLVVLVEKEWVRVSRSRGGNLTADLLIPLVEVTKKLKELWFDEKDRKAVLTVVEQVIPSLEEGNNEGPKEDIRCIVGDLVKVLQVPRASTSAKQRSASW